MNREAVASVCEDQGIDPSELATAIRVLAKLYSQTDCQIHKLVDAMGEVLGNTPRFRDEVKLSEDLTATLLYSDR
jgi:hypothetical protein